jgi:hypothetical protein
MSMPSGARMFLTISAADAEPAADQRSRVRVAFAVVAALLVTLSAPLFWASSAFGADQGQPQAVLVKAADDDDDGGGGDDDNDDTGDGGNNADTTGDNDTGTGRETKGNTDQPGLETGASTNGETDGRDGTGKSETGHTTGVETKAANTDRAGLDTGVSTRGETDPGDSTGKTERR